MLRRAGVSAVVRLPSPPLHDERHVDLIGLVVEAQRVHHEVHARAGTRARAGFRRRARTGNRSCRNRRGPTRRRDRSGCTRRRAACRARRLPSPVRSRGGRVACRAGRTICRRRDPAGRPRGPSRRGNTAADQLADRAVERAIGRALRAVDEQEAAERQNRRSASMPAVLGSSISRFTGEIEKRRLVQRLARRRDDRRLELDVDRRSLLDLPAEASQRARSRIPRSGPSWS